MESRDAGGKPGEWDGHGIQEKRMFPKEGRVSCVNWSWEIKSNDDWKVFIVFDIKEAI